VDAAQRDNLSIHVFDKTAQIIIEGIEKDKVRIFVESDSKMLDILYRLNPKFAMGLIAKQMQSLLS
jgi:hypothetical protein